MARRYEDFMGEPVRILLCEVGSGVIGVPVGPGRVEVVALIIGKDCGMEVERMVAMAAEKMALPDCAMARVSRVENGWKVAGWRVVDDGSSKLRCAKARRRGPRPARCVRGDTRCVFLETQRSVSCRHVKDLAVAQVV
jgi:hypothetical protein